MSQILDIDAGYLYLVISSSDAIGIDSKIFKVFQTF